MIKQEVYVFSTCSFSYTLINLKYTLFDEENIEFI